MKKYVEESAQDTYYLETQDTGTEYRLFSLFYQGQVFCCYRAGPGSIIPDIQKVINELELNNLKYIIPTHIHLDHAGV